MQQRLLGSQGLHVSAIGLGCMSLGIAAIYSSSLHDDKAAEDLIRYALDQGMTLLDSADVYGDSEIKLGRALRGRREQAVVATKFGIVAEGGVPGAKEAVNGRPDYVRAACERSLQRLGIEQIDLYYQHRIDPEVPIEETVGALVELVRQGKVRHLGLSEASVATIRRAHAVHPIAAVQVEYSLWTREPEKELLPLLRELGIGLVAYSPLGRGLLAGRFRDPSSLAASDWRHGNPRFQSENLDANLRLADAVAALAADKGCTPAQLLLAWLLAQGEDIVPIPGTSSVARLEENTAAADIALTAAELDRLTAAVPPESVAGARYAEAGMRLVNR